MAYAMNYEAYKSMDALEAARKIDPEHFFAQFKYAELLYRLRALPRAQEETERAVRLARNGWETRPGAAAIAGDPAAHAGGHAETGLDQVVAGSGGQPAGAVLHPFAHGGAAMKWNVFATAVLVAWVFLLSSGAPLLPLALATGAVAVWNWRKALFRF